MVYKSADVLSAKDFMPQTHSIATLHRAATKCQGCHLYKNATQTVFGTGNEKAKLMIVGEIPGNKEDQTGIPFTGPAGILLRHAIEDTKLDIKQIYFTNVVKHFKFTYLNKQKLHRSPVLPEIKACVPWLEAEIETIRPKIILCLGAVAAKSLMNKNFQIKKQHGKWFKFTNEIFYIASFHPSAILRTRNDTERHELKELFLRDIKKVTRQLAKV